MENYLPVYEKVFYEKTEKTLSTEAVLPDYLPNVARIVRVSVIPSVKLSEITEDSVNTEGRAVFGVVYVSDFGDKLKCAVFPADFSHNFPVRAAKEELSDDGFVDFSVVAGDEKAAILSPRKLSLTCKLTVGAEGISKKKNRVFDPEENESLKKLTGNVSILEISAPAQADVRIEENISLEDGMPGAQEIVFADCSLSVNSARIADGECTFSGNAAFTCMYLSEAGEDGAEYISLSKNIPFTAKASVGAIPDSAYVMPRVTLSGISADAVSDSYGESKLIAVMVNGSINSRAYAASDARVCSDVFCTRYGCECEVRELLYDNFAKGVSDRVSITENIHANIGNMTDIVAQTATVNAVSTEYSDSKLIINAKANLKLVGTNELGGLESTSTSFNFKVPCPGEFDNTYEKYRFDTCIDVQDCKCSIVNGEVKCELMLGVHCAALGRSAVRAVTAVEVDDSKELERNKSEYVIYYPDADDTLWSTAKKYRVSPSELMAINGLKNESELHSLKILVIPR